METLIELAKQVPALAVLALLSWQFLRHLSERDDKFAETLKTIDDACHVHSKELMEQTTIALNKNTEMLGEVRATLDRLNGSRQPN